MEKSGKPPTKKKTVSRWPQWNTLGRHTPSDIKNSIPNPVNNSCFFQLHRR